MDSLSLVYKFPVIAAKAPPPFTAAPTVDPIAPAVFAPAPSNCAAFVAPLAANLAPPVNKTVAAVVAVCSNICAEEEPCSPGNLYKYVLISPKSIAPSLDCSTAL